MMTDVEATYNNKEATSQLISYEKINLTGPKVSSKRGNQ